MWNYQKLHFKEDYSKRWTFTVYPSSPEYPNFLSGLSEVVNKGLVIVSPNNFQCMLTNDGLAYIKERNDIKDFEDLYRF